MTDALQIVGGLVALIAGANVLVRAGTNLACWLGIRPMMIGLTVVSLGTSVPELAVGIDAARGGNGGLAVGNIVGTDLVNLLLILGLSAALVPIALDRATLRYDLPAMTAAALLLYLLAIDGTLTTLDRFVLLLGGVACTAGLVHVGRRETADPEEDPAANGAASADRHREPHRVQHLQHRRSTRPERRCRASRHRGPRRGACRGPRSARCRDCGCRPRVPLGQTHLAHRGRPVRRVLHRIPDVASSHTYLTTALVSRSLCVT
jgi:hypothetical protein